MRKCFLLFMLFLVPAVSNVQATENRTNKPAVKSMISTNAFVLANLDFFLNMAVFSNREFNENGDMLQTINLPRNRKVKK
jgi:hypothetical protein